MKKLEVIQSPPPPADDAVEPSSKRHGYWPQYWRSLEQKAMSHDAHADSWREFPEGAETLEIKGGVSRRTFFGIMGASAALAGVTTGCVRKPRENILPYTKRPEDLIPGQAMYYASAYQVGGTVEGVLVESQDGRPTKLEGNPKHSGSQGATSTWTQATVLDLYDPDRTRIPLHDGEPAPWHGAGGRLGAIDAIKTLLSQSEAGGGNDLGFVVPRIQSPTHRAQLAALRQRFPQARIFEGDNVAPHNAVAAAELIGGKGARSYVALDKTNVVFAADADFLLTDGDSTRLARQWSQTRRVVGPTDYMSRLWVVEPHLTTTGVMADHRLRIKGSQVGDVLIAVARELTGAGNPDIKVPPEVDVQGLPNVSLSPEAQTFVQTLAKDLTSKENLGRSAVIVGERQPVWVHALAHLINGALRNTGQSVRWRMDTPAVETESLEALAEALRGGVKTLVCLGTNPAYDAPGDLGMADLLQKTAVIHIGLWRDETAKLATWHIPLSHFLEAWSDVEASDGTTTVQQPLIESLHASYGMTELLGLMSTGSLLDGYSLLKTQWGRVVGPQFSDRVWRQWLHDGLVTGIPRDPAMPAPVGWGEVVGAVAQGRKPIEGTEIDFHLCPKVADGRFANNAWMQELPHPLTKLTWDNAAYLSAATAAAWGVENGDMVSITVDGRSVEMPVWIAPGQADDTVSVNLGYGRDIGQVSAGVGVDVNPLRSVVAPWIAAASVSPTGGTHLLVSTQDYGSMKPHTYKGIEYEERPIVLERTREEFKLDPNFVEKVNLMPPERLKHLWEESKPRLTGKQQWGMSVDLNTCTGCNACVVACQAENNIPVVGKRQVSNGREMHWMRIDRYYRGDENNPTAVVQPMYCQHCESAPCETVCPVAATTHSPEGLNDMAYNRCIGTRYCSNNCPYKVRRYNFFNYNLGLRPEWNDEDPDGAWLNQMQKNPDVTVRFRGVMEKCTYCVQRIQGAKIDAHVAGNDVVEDGAIVTACQQVCPTGALVFGDIRDADSAVSKAKRSPRDYSVLRDLNTHPRTTYLARIRNPHPDLAPPPQPPPVRGEPTPAGEGHH